MDGEGRERMREYFFRRMKRLVPVLLLTCHELPAPDPDEVADFCREFIYHGTPAFRAVYFAMILLLQALCRLRCRRSIYALRPPEAEEFLESLYSSRVLLLSSVPTLLSMPLHLAYYGRDEVQEALGFEVGALREEALKREVAR